MADTFLFRVGLLGVIMKKFRAVLLLHPIYLGFTLAIGVYRVNKLDVDAGKLIVDMWSDDYYVAMSILQKV